MAGEWESASLSELCEQIADCPHSTPLWTDSGVIVLRNQNIRDGRLDLSSPSYTDELNFEQRSRRARLKAGDLVLTREAPMGEVCMVPENLRCCLGQRMVMLRPDPKKCDSRFLLYSIQSDAVQHEIKVNEGTGSTVSNLRIPLLEALPIPLPPLAEQKAIAGVLGALDDKIELNRRMNATLESMARALFQSWFVDFDPVRAKLDGRKPDGMDEETAALFPDSFQDSELGQIPHGWEVRTADEISVVGIGKTPPRKEHQWFSENPADIPWMSIRDLGEAGVFISKTSEFLRPEAVETFRVRRIPDGTVVLSFKLTMGRVAITDGEMLSNEAIAHFRLKPETPFGSAYLFCYLKGFSYDQLGNTSSIATAINSDMVRGIKVVLPSKGVAAAFEGAVAPMFTQMKNNQNQSCTLATIRDTLLPKLLSGELSVAEREN